MNDMIKDLQDSIKEYNKTVETFNKIRNNVIAGVIAFTIFYIIGLLILN